MAKQTFTTGQVLTAAQLTSLQQTAMLGGAASAKTASYTLVAADAGTTISMTSTSATTITVNTGLFAAGDTVFIQNLGSGNLTITAGTATVATAGSLILPQNDAGILYFVSTSSSVFYDFIQVGATSPLTTKGDLYGFSTSDARIPIGANNTVLTADSGETLGLKWATPAGGGGMTLINTGGTALTGSTVTISSIPATYNNLFILISNPRPNTDSQVIRFRVNNDSTANRYLDIVSSGGSNPFNTTYFDFQSDADDTVTTGMAIAEFYNYASTTTWKLGRSLNLTPNATTPTNASVYQKFFGYNQTTAISELNFFTSSGTMAGGTVYVYGVK